MRQLSEELNLENKDDQDGSRLKINGGGPVSRYPFKLEAWGPSHHRNLCSQLLEALSRRQELQSSRSSGSLHCQPSIPLLICSRSAETPARVLPSQPSLRIPELSGEGISGRRTRALETS